MGREPSWSASKSVGMAGLNQCQTNNFSATRDKNGVTDIGNSNPGGQGFFKTGCLYKCTSA